VISQCICNIVLVFCTVYYPVNRPLSSLVFCFKRNSFRSSRLQHTLSQLQLHKTLPVDKFYADLCVVPAEQKNAERTVLSTGASAFAIRERSWWRWWWWWWWKLETGVPGPKAQDNWRLYEGRVLFALLMLPSSQTGHKNSLCAKFRSLVFTHWIPHFVGLCIRQIHILLRFPFRFYGVARGLLIHTRTTGHHRRTHTHTHINTLRTFRNGNGVPGLTMAGNEGHGRWELWTVNCELRVVSCELGHGTWDMRFLELHAIKSPWQLPPFCPLPPWTFHSLLCCAL